MTARIGCREAVERLWAYIDEELDEVDQQAIDDHLAFCLRCCGELAFAREVRGVLATSAPRLPGEAQGRLEAFIERLDTHDDAGANP